jgi:hypothetical protein
LAKYSGQIVVTAVPTAPAATTERWLRLATDPPAAEAELTVAELAALLDELVGVPDPCSGAPAAPVADPVAALEEALAGPDCDAVAARLRIATNCSTARRTGQPAVKNIYAHWSDEMLAEDYSLAPLGSALILSGPVRSSKVINLIVDVSDAASAPVRYFVNEEARAALWRKQPPRWIGNVIDNKRIMPGPEIGWGGGKVTFGGRVVSGRCELWLPIIYDTWTVSLPGVQVGDKRSYRAKFLGISGLLDQPAEIEIEDEAEGNPDANDCSACGGSTVAFELPENADVFCYEEVVTEFTRPCDDAVQGRAVEYRQVPCPANTLPQLNAGTGAIPALPNYISRQMTRRIASVIASSDYDAISWQEYVKSCCYAPVKDTCKPDCRQITRTWRGQAWPKKEEAVKRQYLGETEIIYVAPEDGICGKRVDRFAASRLCDCPPDSFVYVEICENYVDLFGPNNELLYASRVYTGFTGDFQIPLAGLPAGEYTLVGYNDPKDGSGTSRGALVKGVVYIAGEPVLDFEAGDNDSATFKPGGEFMRIKFKCPNPLL